MTEGVTISGRQFLEVLVEVGVIRSGEKVRRVVIDAPLHGACVLYVERVGDDKMFRVATTLTGIEITAIDDRP